MNKPVTFYQAMPSPRPSRWNWLDPVWLLDDVFRPANAKFWPWLWRQKVPQNFCAFVIGVQDRDHTFAATKNSAGIFAEGWQVGVVSCGFLRLPLVSYKGSGVEAYLGWRPIGAFGWALRRANASPWVNP